MWTNIVYDGESYWKNTWQQHRWKHLDLLIMPLYGIINKNITSAKLCFYWTALFSVSKSTGQCSVEFQLASTFLKSSLLGSWCKPRSRKRGGQWTSDYTIYGSEYTINYLIWYIRVSKTNNWRTRSLSTGTLPLL